MAATTALREALNQGISSGNLVDTKIVVYSYRDSSGRICRPKPLYANSHVLKTVPYFNNRECPRKTRGHSYRASCRHFKVLFGDFGESKPKDFNQEAEADEVGSAEDYGYLSDSDLEDEESPRSSIIPVKSQQKRSRWFSHPRKSSEEHKGNIEKGKVAKITDTAFVTEEQEGRTNMGKVVKIPDMAFVT